MSARESTLYFLELIKEQIKLTDQERSREHFGVVGAFPSAVLEVRGQPEEVVLGGKGSKVKRRPAAAEGAFRGQTWW